MKRFVPILFIFSALFASCIFAGGKRIRGNGNITSQTRSVSSFTGIDVSGDIDVFAKQDSVVSVKIEADENLQEFVHINVDEGILKIKEEDGYNLRSAKGIKVFVSGPYIKSFEASGACSIYGENQITSLEPIHIDMSGACEMKMDLKSPKIDAELSGAGSITLKGETKDFIVDGSGSTHVRCFGLLTENTRIEISGAGSAEVFASIKLDVHVSGAGDVKYAGNPAVSQDISGAGSVKKVENP